MKKIYIAGPLFTEGERILLEKIDEICRLSGFDTYLPHRDAGLFTREEESSRKFFERDLKEIEESSLIVAILNGQDTDSGTSWEIGYGFAKDKPVIGYISDTRKYDPKIQLNPMIFNSLESLAINIDELKKALETKR